MSGSVPRLVGSHEIGVRLGGISRQRVHQITGKAGFPKPLAELQSGRVWAASDVEKWIVVHRPHQADMDS
jgi:hypothetical protein